MCLIHGTDTQIEDLILIHCYNKEVVVSTFNDTALSCVRVVDSSIGLLVMSFNRAGTSSHVSVTDPTGFPI